MQPERNFQGVSCAPGSAQQGRSVQNVSFTFGNHAQRGDRALEGSDLAAEEGYEECDSNAEEGHEEVWGEVHEALSTMGHEDYDETALCARSQASRSSSSSSSRVSMRS